MTTSSSSGAIRRSRPRRTQGVGWHRALGGVPEAVRRASALGRTCRPCRSCRHAGRAPLPVPSRGQNPVCAISNSGAAAFGRAERVLALAAHKPALCAHTAAHDW